ncbi:hypothetical protein MATL_G00122340 [Megalops atlanticus]|uniref:Protocadherin Fat 4-like n=1 Tax=Megalops atlanticus TaxID=7932 RepID=A0A9D3TBM6_MEGAT|nr:hypothetical protein MATL_G00122340 [Megalops atlanticus]
MDTCYFRIRYITFVFHCMYFGNVAVHCTPLANAPDGGWFNGSGGNRSYSDLERKQPRAVPHLHSRTPEDVRRAGGDGTQSQIKDFTQLAFSESVYSFEVNEDTPPGTTVGRVAVLHAEGQGTVVYSVLEDDGDGLLLLSPRSGEFFLSRALDYETERYYILAVGARHGDARFGRVRVYFNVLDVNDNAPVFRPEAYSASVLENSPAGTCILALNVSDADDGINAELDWAVVAGDKDGKFEVNSGGVVCLQGPLDRERHSVYNLTIQVSDRALPASSRLTSVAHIAIHVEDVNDNAPAFVSAASVRIPEDTPLHAVITVIRAVDADAGSNGVVEYSLENLSGSAFRINGSSGRVVLEEPLDRELIDVLTVVLTARDGGSPQHSTSMNLTVVVEDANDNDPSFPQSSYNVTVSEDAPRGTSILQAQAYDPDVGPNGQVRYQLSQGPFLVDSVRGVVVVMDRLDRERSPSHTFTVIAVDQGHPPRSATASVNVTVSDVNDCVPLLSPASLTLHVSENIEDLPQAIHQVSAVDEDLGANSQLTYSIVGGNEEDLFSLSPDGILHLLQSPDREVRAQYTIHIIAFDSGLPSLTGTGTIHILVDDLNDNRPVFPKDVFTVSVYEDIPVGTVFATITASDPDDGVNGQIRYSLEETNAPFAIDKMTGVMFTTGVLDREAVGSYLLTVIGHDTHPTHPLFASATVAVVVEDINDQWPQFLNGPYVANVPATAAPGSIVCAVRAEDADIGINSQLTFSLFGQNANRFSIHPDSGEIFTSGVLKGADDITISVHVEDGGDDPKSDTTTVTVRFQNASEFPIVTVDIRKALLSEDEPLDTPIAVVTAESNRTGPVSYYLASGNFGEVFQLDQQNGELTVKRPLDYELNKEYSIWVEARDAGSPPFSSYAEIHINISDVNDNSPVFSQRVYRCELFENSLPSPVCKVLAVDADSGNFGKVQYSILRGNKEDTFTIGSDTGILRTTKSLDREKISEYKLTIQATDKEDNLNTGTAMVLVVVLDTNDHAPRFSQIFFTEIPEDTPLGFTVIQITSVDEDIGENAVIAYTIIDQRGSLPFTIDRDSGNLVVVRPLDRETRDHYVVTVNANDSAWSISTDVTIDVTDVNDNRPVFSQSSYSVTITETKAREVFVMQVHATDSDLGSNKQILYFIEPPSEIFRVNISTGDILTKQPISLRDSENQSLSFMVIATDCGDVPNYSNTTVTVTFVRYNYFPPDFLPFRSLLSIPFNMDVGTRVIQLSAIDQELHFSADSVEYINSGGNASHFFEVETNSGWVLLKRSLKHSLNTLLTLLVTAKDKGIPPLSSQVAISFVITEENRFAPRFPESWVTFSVPEDLPLGSVIGRVRAEDEDDGVNGLLHYSFESGNEDSLFSVGQNTGLITLKGGLDSEKQGVHFLQVSAKDGGWVSKMAKLNITVNVTDVNDNPPVFLAATYTVSVPENSPIGMSVLQAKATDADAGLNAQITYSLVAGHVDMFAIDSRDGTITTREVFDFELQQTYEVTVKASNKGSLGQFSVAHIHIQITSVNEFIPSFQKSQYNFSISERSPNRTRVGKVSATDFDLGPDGEVFYLLIGPSKRVGFDIDDSSGEIFTNVDLRQHGHGQAVLRVLAKNRGSVNGSDVDETIVLVNVIDANDPPEFYPTFYTAEISEDAAIGISVTKVTAEDQDSVSDWSRFYYSIESGNKNGSFTLDPVTGILSISAHLDREQWPLYNLTVTAIDGASPPATGSATVVVIVGDVNDSPPSLISNEVYVRENQPYGTVVSVLNASDADLPPNQGPFTYWLVNLAFVGAFSLTPDGVLSTTRPLDREQSPAHSVLVVVQDAGTPSLSSTATVLVKVLDENDNPSVPRHIHIEVKYYGSSFPGGHIGNVQPDDPDKSDTFNCSIKSGPRNMFDFPFGKCDLWSTPYQGEATYNITIEANDLLHPSVNNSVYVNYKGFTNGSMDNCVLFYVTSPSFEEFLSFNYLKFVKALNSLFNLQASKTHVFGIKLLANKILLLAAVKSYNGQFLSGEVASSISAAQKKLLEAQSGVEISHITGDPCSVNPCQNGATCTKNIHISQDIAVLESSALIFVSPKQVEIFNCSCPAGFSGTVCESDTDECGEIPCENGATCVNYPGGFTCLCVRGFSGIYCQYDVDECQCMPCQNGGTCLNVQGEFHCRCGLGYEGEFCEQFVDHCASSPCLQGTCVNYLTGYACHCPFGVSGVNCEELSYGFEELSYMEFSSLDPRNNVIYLELATVRQNSLLLYNHGGPSSPEFLALEIVEGKARLSYDLGGGAATLETGKTVADGLFHSITARRIGRVASLQVDSCSADETHGFCFSQTEGVGSERTLDVGSYNLTLGGIRSMDAILLHPTQVQTHDFVGCVRNAKINNIPLDVTLALAWHNVLERCPRTATSPCDSSVCLNGGVCRDHWSHQSCVCGDLFTGINCDTEISEDHALRLNGQAYVEYVIKESYRRDQQLRDLVEGGSGKADGGGHVTGMEIKLRTTGKGGTLLFILGRTGHTALRIVDGKLLYTFRDNASGHLTEIPGEVMLADGHWHVLHLFKDGPITMLLLDGLLAMNTTEPTFDLNTVSMDRIVLGGGLPGRAKNQQPGFTGCVEYFRYNGQILPFGGFSEMVEALPSPALQVQTGCTSSDACVAPPCSEDDLAFLSCLSGPCLSGGACDALPWGNGSCACVRNVTEDLCKLCPSETGTREACPKPRAGAPLWIIGVVIPATFVTICLALLVFLRVQSARTRRAKRRAACRLPPRAKQGADNKAFRCNGEDAPARGGPRGGGREPDVIRAEKQRHRGAVGPTAPCSGEAGPPSLQTGPGNSELEYYEIDSSCSVFHSGAGSLKLKGSGGALDGERTKKEPVVKGGGQQLSPSSQKSPQDWTNRGKAQGLIQGDLEESYSFTLKSNRQHPQEVADSSCERLHRGQCGYDCGLEEEPPFSPHPFSGRMLVPDLVDPPLGLSAEEVRRLNAPLEQQDAIPACPGHAHSAAVTDSSESETHSSFTCSEYGYERELSFVSEQGYLCERALSATYSSRRGEKVSGSDPTPLQDGAPLAESQREADSTSPKGPQHWEDMLNLGLHFETYAQVFEDIAGLPIELQHDFDWQSEVEEII